MQPIRFEACSIVLSAGSSGATHSNLWQSHNPQLFDAITVHPKSAATLFRSALCLFCLFQLLYYSLLAAESWAQATPCQNNQGYQVGCWEAWISSGDAGVDWVSFTQNFKQIWGLYPTLQYYPCDFLRLSSNKIFKWVISFELLWLWCTNNDLQNHDLPLTAALQRQLKYIVEVCGWVFSARSCKREAEVQPLLTSHVITLRGSDLHRRSFKMRV